VAYPREVLCQDKIELEKMVARMPRCRRGLTDRSKHLPVAIAEVAQQRWGTAVARRWQGTEKRRGRKRRGGPERRAVAREAWNGEVSARVRAPAVVGGGMRAVAERRGCE
jgi:hypothetical protein